MQNGEQKASLAAGWVAKGRIEGLRLGELPGDARPRDAAEAYAAQDALHSILVSSGRGRPVAHKIGCTTPVMQAFLGIDSPCAGRIFDRDVHFQEALFDMSGLLHPGVECELAVFIGASLEPGGWTFTAESVRPAVEAVFPAIEVVDDRWEDYKSVSTPSLIADDFFARACVVGEPVAEWQSIDLGAVTGRMTINGGLVGTGVGGDIMGHPFNALAWLANHLAARGKGLAAGEIVLLGSIVETKWVERGDTVRIEIDGLGSAEAEFR